MVPFPVRARTFGIALTLAITSLGLFAAAPAAAEGPQTWDIQVGGGDFNFTQLTRFYPADITVHPGDLVNFNWGGFHTVTFNPPAGLSVLDYISPAGAGGSNKLDMRRTFVNGTPAFGGPGSGQPPAFTVTIGSSLPTGSYNFQCMLHQFMHGVIRVTHRGELPSTNAQNTVLAQAQIAADMARAAALDNRLTRGVDEGDGVQVGASTRTFDLTKYYPSAITIQSGDRVSFNDPDLLDPHSVTFGPESADPNVQLFPYGNPGSVNPGDSVSSGYLFSRSQYDYWNLRVVGRIPGFPPIRPMTRFSATFNNPGTVAQTFLFYCEIHGGIGKNPVTGQPEVFGMSGSITVLPANNDESGGGG